MNRSGLLLGLLASVACLGIAAPSFADTPVQATVLSACGGMNYPVGQARTLTQDQTGTLCTAGGGGGGGNVVITAPLGSQTAAASVATTINGTLPAFAANPIVKIDQTTPGTTNGFVCNSGCSGGGAVTLASGAVASGAYSSGSIASGAVASGAYASGSYASGAISSGADVTEGSTSPSVTCSTTWTVNGCLSQLHTDATSPIPAGTNAIGSIIPNPVTSTNGSTTITTGNTFQTLLASNAARKGCLIQNPIAATETLFVSVGVATGSATTASSFGLSPGSAFSCAAGSNVITDNIAVTAATTAHAFVETNQ